MVKRLRKKPRKYLVILQVCLLALLPMAAYAQNGDIIFEPTNVSVDHIEFSPIKIQGESDVTAINGFCFSDPETAKIDAAVPVSFPSALASAIAALSDRYGYSAEEIEGAKLVYSLRNLYISDVPAYYQLSFFFAGRQEIVSCLINANGGCLYRTVIDNAGASLSER